VVWALVEDSLRSGELEMSNQQHMYSCALQLRKASKQFLNKIPLENLLASADELLSELGDMPLQPNPDVEDIAFFRCPLSQAHA
jgi:hypothetical protein